MEVAIRVKARPGRRTCTGLARTPDCRLARPIALGHAAARTVKRPGSATIRGVFQPTAAGILLAADQVIALRAAWHFSYRSIVMEDPGLRPLHRRVAGIDVHRMLHVVTALIEQSDGSMQRHTRDFGGFKRDGRALAAWLAELGVELAVIMAWVVNAHMIKHVPGRKTDMADSEWLAVLARFCLVRASFIPPQDLRELRLVSRYRRKLSAIAFPGRAPVCAPVHSAKSSPLARRRAIKRPPKCLIHLGA